jgi:hypothetical protein
VAQPQPTDFLALPIVGTDLIAFFRKGDISKPLYVRYSTLLNAIIAAAGTGSSFQLTVQDEDVTISSAAQFLNFVGDGVTVTPNGTGVDITIDGAPDITADNGLTKDTATNIQLGGELLKDTQITSEEFQLSVLGDSTFPKRVFYVQNSGTGTAIEGVGLSSGAGVAGINNSGTGVIGSSTNGFAVRAVSSGGSGIAFDAVKTASSTNTIEVVATIKRETSGTGANNIGGSIDYYSEADSIASIPMAMRHIWRWVNASFASRVSQFELNLVANAIEQRVLAINGNGQATLDKYGVGTFESKPTYGIGSDASGNLVEYNALPVVVSTSITAELNTDYIMVASSTFADPTPAEGEGYSVFVRNGSATIGAHTYSIVGTTVKRIYHSGAWHNYATYDAHIDVYTASAAAYLDIPFPVGFNAHEIQLTDVIAGTAASELWMRVLVGGVVQSGASDYVHYRALGGVSTAWTLAGAATDSKIVLFGAALANGASGRSFCGNIQTCNVESTTYQKKFTGQIAARPNGGGFLGGVTFNGYNSTNAIDGVRILCNSGTISGIFVIRSYP